MDLELTPAQQAFQEKARAWLADHAARDRLPSMDTADGFAAHRAWERTLHAGGWGTVAWPVEYGGRGADLVEWLLFEEEYYAAGSPARVAQNGISLMAPTLMEHGTDEQKRRFLPPMAAGDEIWCQGWSEPDAGSDLAALRSRADRDGDAWVLNGQKTWCSRGAFADWLFGLFRSEPGSTRHHGLTMVLVALDMPGISVRPIRQLDGTTGFAEVFFDQVRVPVEQTLGAPGDGWRVAMSTAGFERGLLLRSPGRFTAAARRLEQLWHSAGAPADVRDDVVRALVDAEAYRWYVFWTVARIEAGEDLGAEASLTKIFWSELDVHLHRTALRLLGARGPLTGAAPDAVDEARWLDGFLFALAGPIYAGTNEIQRNIVAERVLGLPRAPRPGAGP